MITIRMIIIDQTWYDFAPNDFVNNKLPTLRLLSGFGIKSK